MVRVDLRDCEGDLVASIDTAEGVIPRVGETIRVIDIDYKVEFVRWTLTDEGTSVQVMVHQEPKAAHERAAEEPPTGAGVHPEGPEVEVQVRSHG
jgi:hypothetical protein